MNPFERISHLSPLPIIDLTKPPELPEDGLLIPITDTCKKHFSKGGECERHYLRIAKLMRDNEPIQCPFGFASMAFRGGGVVAAITGFVPYPRLGGSREQQLAKKHPEVKVGTESVQRAILRLIRAQERFSEVENAVTKSQSMALHEIRKFNRTIKHQAERLCKKESPDDPDKASKEVVTIYKTSELMSHEFDVIQVLAEAGQAMLPLNTVSELYRIFDKIVRIYNGTSGGRRVTLRSASGFYPRVVASDKTLHILPSVFIDNALKYSSPGSETRITLEPDNTNECCIVTVTNESDGQQILDNRVFLRGYRASPMGDGSGNGLYAAQLIAQQHNTKIEVESVLLGPYKSRHTFRIKFRCTTDTFFHKKRSGN